MARSFRARRSSRSFRARRSRTRGFRARRSLARSFRARRSRRAASGRVARWRAASGRVAQDRAPSGRVAQGRGASGRGFSLFYSCRNECERRGSLAHELHGGLFDRNLRGQLEESALTKDEFAALEAMIMKEVPEGELRDQALKRITNLNPEIFGPEASEQETLKRACGQNRI